MKANELSCKDLMVGDWVIFHDSGYASDETTWKEDRVCQIDAIDVDVRVKWYDEDGYKEDWPHVSTFCLSPIPLTPEILEKNGWVYNNEDEKFFPQTWVGGGLMLQGADDCGYRIVVTSDYDDEDTNNTPFVIIYVHELQHALRLRRIKKEIEL